MLAFLMMGAVVASFSEEAAELSSEIDNQTTLLCVVFFVHHGSELDVRSFANAGMIGVAYIVCRIVGKYLGIYSSAKLVGEPEEVQKWLGATILAEADAAITLCTIAMHEDEQLGRDLQNTILGSVVIFEIAGPFCIRLGVLQAGEMPLSQAIYHVGHTPLEQAREVGSRVSSAFGGGLSTRRSMEESQVADLMRRSQSISENATFESAIDHIEHSHDDIFPVVNTSGIPDGAIYYGAINDVLYDPHAVELIRSSDIMESIRKKLLKSEPASHVIDYLGRSNDDCVLVTDDADPFVFLGVVRRPDVTTMLIQERHYIDSEAGPRSAERHFFSLERFRSPSAASSATSWIK